MAYYIKSPREIEGIRDAGRIVAQVLKAAAEAVRPGISLKELEAVCERSIRNLGGKPTFLGYRGFPGAVCISVNEEVVHGIPDGRVLVEGDIVKIDIGVTKDGFIADAARTFEVGRVSPEVHRLVSVTEQAFWKGFQAARAGNRVRDISRAIQDFVEAQGYSVVRELHGHGVGIELHEEPAVPNFVMPGRGPKLVTGLVLAIEPMVNMGKLDVQTGANGWTVIAVDGKPSAHYENTVLITDNEPEVLTR